MPTYVSSYEIPLEYRAGGINTHLQKKENKHFMLNNFTLTMFMNEPEKMNVGYHSERYSH